MRQACALTIHDVADVAQASIPQDDLNLPRDMSLTMVGKRLKIFRPSRRMFRLKSHAPSSPVMIHQISASIAPSTPIAVVNMAASIVLRGQRIAIWGCRRGLISKHGYSPSPMHRVCLNVSWQSPVINQNHCHRHQHRPLSAHREKMARHARGS